jgi:hypothetical protein
MKSCQMATSVPREVAMPPYSSHLVHKKVVALLRQMDKLASSQMQILISENF